METIKNRLTCFRCPSVLLASLDELATKKGVSRSSLIVKAIQQLNKEVHRRRGRLVPPIKNYDSKLLSKDK